MRRAGGARSHRHQKPQDMHLFAPAQSCDEYKDYPGTRHDARSALPMAIAGAYIVFGIAYLLPIMFTGLWVGRRLTNRLSREAFVRLVTLLVLASGLALIGRYLSA